MTLSLTPEQLLIIADEFCAFHHVQVRDFSALVAAAAVPGARIDGIRVHSDVFTAAAALSTALVALKPLTGLHSQFAEVCRQVYLSHAQ